LRVTITDIAAEAKVSKATVSRVLNDSGSVDPQTRERVSAVIQKRKYSPSATARSLSKRTSSAIGIIVPEIGNPFFGELLKGASEIIDANNLTMICCNSDDSPEKDKRALNMLKEQRVRGLIYTAAVDYSSPEEKNFLTNIIKEIHAPTVLVDREIDYLNVDGVYFDDFKSAYDATMAFIKAGHRKIGLLNALPDRVLPRSRQSGYLQALNDAGIKVNPEYIFNGEYDKKKSYEITKKCLQMPDPPTAMLTCNNFTSMGFLKALYEEGKSIPKDISCIGFDKIEALDIMSINFNYIYRDAFIVGKKAMELLINRMAFPDKAPAKVIVESPMRIKEL
jgi:LacI family transcriptional regulator